MSDEHAHAHAPENAFTGRWEAVSGRLGASAIPLPATTLTLEATRYTVKSPQGTDHGNATWDLTADPVTLDMRGTSGAHSGNTIHAIARTRGPVLQLCYAVDGSKRPTTFDVPAGAVWVTVRYKRLD
ncbi:TIGR03067 domain-containing protein [Actomonas aquatica]|uniref:TIGR03067 domain-containing protein n=1 Tax=Actomonas aquatica TaxID=2866162 RepID=A0ABZ1C4X4_9BACT|nr:TIGR03067 domain-containing protein [Opitutus sp. WL0086]WRQ86644.1 TIGR03067 domain-containing protein [Opitutus sp. WL0086]